MFRKKIKGFSQAALEAIDYYSWPGNVRELEKYNLAFKYVEK